RLGERRGALGAGAGEFGAPVAIAVADGRVYVADRAAGRVKVYDLRGAPVGSFAAGLPLSVAVPAGADEVYVGDAASGVVRVFTRAGVALRTIGDAQSLTRVGGVAVGRDGTVYVVDSFQSQVAVFSHAGRLQGGFGEYGAGPGLLRVPMDVALDGQGRLVVTNTENARLERFTPEARRPRRPLAAAPTVPASSHATAAGRTADPARLSGCAAGGGAGTGAGGALLALALAVLARRRGRGLLVLALLALAAPAAALDPPHDPATLGTSCPACHTMHRGMGLSLTSVAGNANLCMSCHTGTGVASALPFASGDQAVPGTSGSSHRWDAVADNAARGASAPLAPEMASRLEQGKVTCSACHDQHSQRLAPFDPAAPAAPGAAGRHFQRVANDGQAMCVDCHAVRHTSASVRTYTGQPLTHPVDVPLPGAGAFRAVPADVGGGEQVEAVFGTATGGAATSLIDAGRDFTGLAGLVLRLTSGANRGATRAITSASGATLGFAALPAPVAAGATYTIDRDGNPTNDLLLDDNGAASGRAGNVVCMTCHGVHYADSDSSTFDDRPRPGDGMLLRRTRTTDEVCTGCHTQQSHNDPAGTGKFGAWGATVSCTTCHTAHATRNVDLVAESITTPAGTTAAIDLRDTSGPGAHGLVTGTTPGRGPCEVCHTRTDHYRADGTGSDQGHANVAATNTQDCLSCHRHRDGFKPACAGCHLPTPATEHYPGAGGAHQKHVVDLGYGCQTCHTGAIHNQGDGVFDRANVQIGFGARSFAGGTTVSNGGAPAESYNGGSPTCTVGCHNPVPAEPNETPSLAQSASWTAGTLGCSACHDTQGAMVTGGTAGGVTYASRHLAASSGVDVCQSCSVVASCKTCTATSEACGCDAYDSCSGACTAPRTCTLTDCSLCGANYTTVTSCSQCGWTPGGAVDAATERAGCQQCHDQAQHTSGITRVTPAGGAPIALSGAGAAEVDPLCRSCHDGAGLSFGARAPANVVAGYTSLSGDFHGARAGTGWGGTLAAPYARGQAALPCETCHTKHGSPHAYLFRTQVNGVTISTPIKRSGEGAEQLCRACHLGTPHEGCSYGNSMGTCHTSDPVPPPSACFYCHTHNGIQNWGNPRDDQDCGHCHGAPPTPPALTDVTPPRITAGPTATPSATYATITWTTDEASTSYVEWQEGPTCCTQTTGNGGLTASHSVLLTGLQPLTTYSYRVRSADAVRNEATFPVQQFTTGLSDPPAQPTLIHRNDIAGTGSVSATFQWNPAVDPNGDPVEYLVQVATVANFASVSYTSGWIAATSWTTTIAAAPRYFWRVMARDAAHPIYTSAWSSSDNFGVSLPPPAPAPVHQADILTATSVQVTLTWGAVTAPDGDAVQYQVQVDDNAAFTSVNYSTSVWQTATSWTIWLPTGYAWNWRVMARDAAHPGLTSAWSSTDMFRVYITDPPTTPTLIHEPDVTVPVPAAVTLQWNAATDPNGDPVQYLVQLSTAATFTTIAYSSGWIAATSWTVTVADQVLYYWRVQARDGAHTPYTSAWSAVDTFTVIGGPPAPALIDQGDLSSTTPVDIGLRWNAVAAPDGDPVEYRVVLDDDPAFGSPSHDSGWIGATLYTAVAVAPGPRYYWRVMARDATHPLLVSAWSGAATFAVLAAAAPPAPALVNQPDYYSNGLSTAITLSWNAVAAPDGDAVEYRVQVDDASDFSSPNYQSGWQSGLTWALTVPASSYFYWRVQARDAVHTGSESPWSAVDVFADLWTSSCPFIYVWNGTELQYVTDVQGEVLGLPASSPASRGVPLYRAAHVVLPGLVPTAQGEYVVRLRETLTEVSYVDEARLLVVDHPAGTRVVSSTQEVTYPYGYVEPLRLYTLRDPRPPVAATDARGADVLTALATCDGAPAPAGIDDPDATYTVDLGAVADPANAKLVITGWSIFGASLRYAGATTQPFIEVPAAGGGWVKVKDFGTPAGDLKTMVIDVGGLLNPADPRVRVHLGRRSGARWVIDCLALDDSAPAAITVTELDPTVADLHHRGAATFTPGTMERRWSALDDTQPDVPGA
ncbi:MAG TPA: fibronectin type III domain-containing protein, partial [Polyangia bacterium]